MERNDMRQEMRSLKESYENAVEKLKEKERQLEAAQTENETLKLKVQKSRTSTILSARLNNTKNVCFNKSHFFVNMSQCI